MSDPTEQERREIEERLSELRPLVEEYQLLQDAIIALGPVREAKAGVSSSRKHADRRGVASRAPSPDKSGDLGGRVLLVVQAQPGITIPKLASQLNVNPTDLYRVLQELKANGTVARRARGWLVPDASRTQARSRARKTRGKPN